MTQGSEWATEGWGSAPEGDRWKMSEAEGRIVRLRMKVAKDMPPGQAGKPWRAIIADVDVIDSDGKGYVTHGDVALSNAWVLSAFEAHLPYSAVGVIESYKGNAPGARGFQLRAVTEAEQALVNTALDLPGF